jgi:Tfp pilus assembly protein PilX
MTPIRRQRGTTLIVALIMLVLLTLFAVSSLNTANTNIRVVGNMQAKAEAINVAQETIEKTISTTTFISNPANAVPDPCGTANTRCVDINSDGTPEFTIRLNPQPSCVVVSPIKNANLDPTNQEDLACASQQQQQFGVSGAVTGDSLCSQTVWEIRAVATDSSTGATATITQGIGVRISADDAGTSCI